MIRFIFMYSNVNWFRMNVSLIFMNLPDRGIIHTIYVDYKIYQFKKLCYKPGNARDGYEISYLDTDTRNNVTMLQQCCTGLSDVITKMKLCWISDSFGYGKDGEYFVFFFVRLGRQLLGRNKV